MSHDTPAPRTGQVIPWPGRPSEAAAPPPPPPPPSETEATAARESAERAQHRRTLWLRESKIIAGSYLINGVFLAVFALTGTVHWSATALYVLPGWMTCAVACALIASGHSLHWNDPAVSDAQSFAGMVICGAGIALYPEMTFLYVLILFTIFLGATYRMSRIRINLAWFGASALIGVATLSGHRTLQLPHATTAEQVAAWACFAATLAHCVLLSLINSGHNLLLRQRGQQVADTLAQIERLANFDELTSLPNRRNLLRTLDDEMARSGRDGSPLAVALLDLDHFKAVNDTRGHLVGDHALQTFAAAVQTHRRPTDSFGRHGGEEFLLILPDTVIDDAHHAVEQLRRGVATAAWHTVSPGLHVTFSAGLAAWQPGDTVEQLLSRADHALYGAKHAGRDCLRVG
jgi:diguanylate cyclase (GGDEF)-like protein